MRRFILGWKMLGYAGHLSAEIVGYADAQRVLGLAPAQQMPAVCERILSKAKMPVNAEKARCLQKSHCAS
ncbi:MAG: hypothetical protein OXM02_14970 [Bacteroidota bacterium]|nr:hypothetical protein [Bacteroidota bacterium]MDE2835799.1 hypothetical protein [Bacteroidota bacterium]MDE2956803.1 hypothetical protein [Bacteroidota bacterium]